MTVIDYKGYRIEVSAVGRGWRASIFSPGSTSPWPNSPVNLEKSGTDEIVEEAKRVIEMRLGPRLVACAEAALGVKGWTAFDIFRSTDEKKLKRCATLFACVSPAGSVFQRLLDQYFQGERCPKTLRLLGSASDV